MRVTLVVLLVLAAMQPADRKRAVLAGFATLPADTFTAGPPSGAFMKNGLREPQPPFQSQPVQGFSSIAPDADGWFWALSDNGFGSRVNSPDYLLRIYRVRPVWAEKRVVVDDEFVSLSDPRRLVPFHIVNEHTPDRLLTGADFDPESMVRMPDGTFWIGDEFGPFLLHVDAAGQLLAPPFEAPGVRSPDHPLVPAPNAGEASAATVGRSRGFEGLAVYPPRGTLVALLEAGLVADNGARTRALEFDPATGQFTGKVWMVPLEAPGHAMTELVPFTTLKDRPQGPRDQWLRYFDVMPVPAFLTIERDNAHGPAARFKRIFGLNLAEPLAEARKLGPHLGADPGASGAIDLLAIDDPDRLGPGGAATFTFPFVTTEAIWPEWPDLILVNDNNYPAGDGRTAGQRDNTEFIKLRLPAR